MRVLVPQIQAMLRQVEEARAELAAARNQVEDLTQQLATANNKLAALQRANEEQARAVRDCPVALAVPCCIVLVEGLFTLGASCARFMYPRWGAD